MRNSRGRLLPVQAPNRIREIRLERKQLVPAAFSIAALARRVGVTEGILRDWELGRIRPRQRHAKALARELGVRVEDLGIDSPPREQP